MPMKDYRTIVVGTDGSTLAEPTVGRAAWLAKHNDADLVIICAYAQMSRRTEAKNIATLGGDTRTGQVLGARCRVHGLGRCHVRVASAERATVTAALLIDGDPVHGAGPHRRRTPRGPHRARRGPQPHPRGSGPRLDRDRSGQARLVRRAHRPTGQRCRRIGGPGGRRPGMTRPAASHRHARPGGALVLDDRAPALNRRAAGARPETLNWRARSSPVQHRLRLVSAPSPHAEMPQRGRHRPVLLRQERAEIVPGQNASVQPFLVSSVLPVRGPVQPKQRLSISASRWRHTDFRRRDDAAPIREHHIDSRFGQRRRVDVRHAGCRRTPPALAVGRTGSARCTREHPTQRNRSR